jgi:hypothetical protein
MNLEATNTTDNSSSTTTAPPPSPTTPKPMNIREPLEFQVELLDYTDPSSEAQADSMKK